MLQVERLTVAYGHVRALEDMTLAIHAGEIVALVGPNGAGKSTLLRTISGVVRPLVGKIRLDGQEIQRWPPDRIVTAGVAHVPEGRRVFSSHRVEENLELGAFCHRGRGKTWITKRIQLVYELFPPLRERRRQYAGSLSSGEQQMLAIGRALMSEPRVLLLDEPSLGLAPMVVTEVFSALLQLKAQGCGVLVVEQNTKACLPVADRAYVVDRGRIIWSGEATALPEAELQRVFLGVGPDGGTAVQGRLRG